MQAVTYVIYKNGVIIDSVQRSGFALYRTLMKPEMKKKIKQQYMENHLDVGEIEVEILNNNRKVIDEFTMYKKTIGQV